MLYRVFATGAPPGRVLTPRTGDSLLPAIVNYQVVNGPTGTRIFAPRQFGPSIGGADPFEDAFRTALAGGSAAGPVVFVDDWQLYHVKVGDVHFGTNLFKENARVWWQP
jgi:protein-arginine deiminase